MGIVFCLPLSFNLLITLTYACHICNVSRLEHFIYWCIELIDHFSYDTIHHIWILRLKSFLIFCFVEAHYDLYQFWVLLGVFTIFRPDLVKHHLGAWRLKDGQRCIYCVFTRISEELSALLKTCWWVATISQCSTALSWRTYYVLRCVFCFSLRSARMISSRVERKNYIMGRAMRCDALSNGAVRASFY